MVKSSIEGICREVEYVFTIQRLVYVWPELDRVIPRSEMQAFVKKLWSDYELLFEPESPGKFFLKYTQRELNPILNKKLGRPEDFPTWNNLLAYGLRTVIAYDQYCNSLRKDRIQQDLRFKFYPGVSLSERRGRVG